MTFTEEIYHAYNSKYYQIALNSLFVIPDNCAALQDPDGKTSGKKYKEWCNKYYLSRYEYEITAEDLYSIRCSLLHQSSINANSKMRILFQPPGPIKFHHTSFTTTSGDNSVLHWYCINIHDFMMEMLQSHHNWEKEMKDDSVCQTNIKNIKIAKSDAPLRQAIHGPTVPDEVFMTFL
ncbi:hypothetical protein ACLOAU_14725 [Niabella sp. CJ426]|uniref:hypothetical protein n=1 Tax=Niabella sp. CJ426 TaxID=3393740 RepID=UPI003D0173BB